MQHVIELSVDRLGALRCMAEASMVAKALAHTTLHGALLTNYDGLARQVAAMEQACEQLRLVVGSANVDLHRVEALARMQQRLRQAEAAGAVA